MENLWVILQSSWQLFYISSVIRSSSSKTSKDEANLKNAVSFKPCGSFIDASGCDTKSQRLISDNLGMTVGWDCCNTGSKKMLHYGLLLTKLGASWKTIIVSTGVGATGVSDVLRNVLRKRRGPDDLTSWYWLWFQCVKLPREHPSMTAKM